MVEKRWRSKAEQGEIEEVRDQETLGKSSEHDYCFAQNGSKVGRQTP